MSDPYRLAAGGLVDRDRPLDFQFDGRSLSGFAGDTLASALLGAGARLVGRSFKYHRPRGVFGSGLDEPNALVNVAGVPNVLATSLDLHPGLVCSSQNRWPSLAFDLMAATQLAGPAIGAGFYYKTFMGWPGWSVFEPFIRRAAGMGAPAEHPREPAYEHLHAHCDVLVVGAGPAGLAAALEASAAGRSVILADADSRVGGRLLADRESVDGADAAVWIDAAMARLRAEGRTRILTRTTAYGVYEGRQVRLLQRRSEPHSHRLWRLEAERMVVAAGALERSLPFAGNDVPGVMLASAVRAYVNRYAVAPGRQAVVFTSNDDGLATAQTLRDAGISVALIADARPVGDGRGAAALGVDYLAGARIAKVDGTNQVTSVEVVSANDPGRRRRIACDCVAVAGGWTPQTQLHAQAGGRLNYDPLIGALTPTQTDGPLRVAGAAAGWTGLDDCIASGRAAGAWAAGRSAPSPLRRRIEPDAFVLEPADKGRSKTFVDLQTDVTLADVDLAIREGYGAIEHLKRYTTWGMGVDQGKTSQMLGMQALARTAAGGVEALAPVRARPPYAPVALGALAGLAGGDLLKPTRRTPMDAWHQANGAVFTPSGLWLRPRHFPAPGEGLHGASQREASAVRQAAGLADISTLGKFEVIGPDAATFLDRLYVGRPSAVAVGKVVYGLMLREDGLVFDDGTVARLAEDRFFITTTTAMAAKVLAHIDYFHQVVWPELRLAIVPVTERWAAMALGGPRSREVLTDAAPELDLSNEAFPHQAFRTSPIFGVPARLARMSFSGERAYEIYVPSQRGEAVWAKLLEVGRRFGLTPYGLEAVSILRIEMGHLGDGEIDGRTTLADLRMGRFAARGKDHVGARMAGRMALTNPHRPTLVGLIPVDGRTPIPPGAQLVEEGRTAAPMASLGHVTATAFSPTLNRPIGLGLLQDGKARVGQTLVASSPVHDKAVPVKICPPGFLRREDRSLHD